MATALQAFEDDFKVRPGLSDPLSPGRPRAGLPPLPKVPDNRYLTAKLLAVDSCSMRDVLKTRMI